jgi:hypothetical protein
VATAPATVRACFGCRGAVLRKRALRAAGRSRIHGQRSVKRLAQPHHRVVQTLGERVAGNHHRPQTRDCHRHTCRDLGGAHGSHEAQPAVGQILSVTADSRWRGPITASRDRTALERSRLALAAERSDNQSMRLLSEGAQLRPRRFQVVFRSAVGAKVAPRRQTTRKPRNGAPAGDRTAALQTSQRIRRGVACPSTRMQFRPPPNVIKQPARHHK